MKGPIADRGPVEWTNADLVERFERRLDRLREREEVAHSALWRAELRERIEDVEAILGTLRRRERSGADRLTASSRA